MGQASTPAAGLQTRQRLSRPASHYACIATNHRRRLPHISTIGQPLFVTFRLHGSLPAGRDFPKESMTSGEAFLAMDRLLDASLYGPTYLRQPRIAELVRSCLQYPAQTDYELHAWAIMPNHVHLLLTPITNVSSFLRRIKGYSARQANAILGRTGKDFWLDESYDHLVRTGEAFRRIERYILGNPVRAGLARTVEEYAWSSGSAGGSGDPPQA